MLKCQKYFITLSIILLLTDTVAFGEHYWGKVLLLPLKNEKLQRAANNLELCNYIKYDPSSKQNYIFNAYLRGERIIVWFGKATSEKSFICVYTLEGKFDYGYEVKFSRRNGVFNVNIVDDSLMVFVSNVNCIYALRENEILYYEALPEYTGYLYEYNDNHSNTSVQKVISTSHSVILRMEDGTSKQLFDFENNNPHVLNTYSLIGYLLIFFLALFFALSYVYNNKEGR